LPRIIATLLMTVVLSSAVIPKAMATPYEARLAVPAQNFLGADWMQSPYHRVAPMAHNNGFSNVYTIETSDGIYTIRGTNQTRILIKEIEATYMLRQKPTIGAVGKSLKNRTTNLVTTPLRTINAVGDRIDAVGSVEDAVLFTPRLVGDVGGGLVNGVGEMAVTGVRIVKGAAGTKCSGLECIQKAGEDIWSGINSLAGKHNASRRLHASLGTDRETRNKNLKREIDRLSYAEAYTGATFKFIIPNAELNYLSGYQRGIGYYNNGEFLAEYEDAHRGRNRDKDMLRNRGVSQETIDQLYANEAFTNKDRANLSQALSALGPTPYLSDFVNNAALAPSPYAAQNKLVIYQYYARLAQSGTLANFVAGPSILAQRKDGTLILPFAADYIQWSPDAAIAVQNSARTAQSHGQRAEIHVLGHASQTFKNNSQRLGVNVIEFH